MNSNMPFSVENALAFIEINGVVLVSAKGAAARLIDVIAGEDIVGNWWSHPHANAIYNTLWQVQASDQVLVCKLVDGKVTLVHRRLWPALARLATRFEPQQIARVPKGTRSVAGMSQTGCLFRSGSRRQFLNRRV